MIVQVVLTLISILTSFGGAYAHQDQTSSRANTLLDDADDIQRQLDNEARDRIKYGGHKTIWILNFPTGAFENKVVVTRSVDFKKLQENIKGNLKKTTQHRQTSSFEPSEPALWVDKENSVKHVKHVSPIRIAFRTVQMTRDWSYRDQSDWHKIYPDCGRGSQSPVDLPYNGLIKATGARKLTFNNYDKMPAHLAVENDGRTVSLRGSWKPDVKPFIYGGAAHGRRYTFYSMSLHWPSEHLIGGLKFPIESQVLHISAEYQTAEEAVKASAHDPLAFLGVVNIYRFDNHTQDGLSALIKAAKCKEKVCRHDLPKEPLQFYNPPFKEYACYQGSLTTPPCKEAVLWLVRARALSVTRSDVETVEGLFGSHAVEPVRVAQPLNDRKIYFFNK